MILALKDRPIYKGYPVPYVTAVDDQGIPDFKTHDITKKAYCADRKLCAICGKPMISEILFVGSKRSCRRRNFGEPPMHRECLNYAWDVCPWLAFGREWAKERPKAIFSLPRPKGKNMTMGIYTTNSYKWGFVDELIIEYQAGIAIKPIEYRGRGIV